MSFPAGAPSPAPNSLADAGEVHAVDGDGTALCSESITVEQVNGRLWADVPRDQRCPKCALIMGAGSPADR
jgi:hypothetical protein